MRRPRAGRTGRAGPAVGGQPLGDRAASARPRTRGTPGPAEAGAGARRAAGRTGRSAPSGSPGRRPDLAVLVADPDRQPAGEHLVVLQLLDQPLEVADQPGVEDARVGRRLAEAPAPREGLVRRPARVDRRDGVAVQLPPELSPEAVSSSRISRRSALARSRQVVDAPGLQPRGPSAGDAGDLGDRPVGQEPRSASRSSTASAPNGLADVGDQLGQRPRPRDPDRHRHPDRLPDPVADRLGRLLQRLAARAARPSKKNSSIE